MNSVAPNIAAEVRNAVDSAMLTIEFRNSARSTIGCGARNSTDTNNAANRTPASAIDRINGDVQE